MTEAEEVTRDASLVERVAEHTAETQAKRVELPSGRVVTARVEQGEERVTIQSRDGLVELEVRLTPEGPVLRFRAADIELSSKGDVRVDCDRFEVRAAREIVHKTEGDLKQEVGGDASLHAGGELSQKARRARIEAERGDVEIEANDDVRLLGERIKLNC